MELLPLFVESNFEMNGSNIRFEQLINKAVSYGYSSICLTDSHMHGALRFFHLCKKANIKPILGLQLYIKEFYNGYSALLLVYAKNYAGYQSLLKLSTLSQYGKITLNELIKLESNLIILIDSDETNLFINRDFNYSSFVQKMNNLFNTWYVSITDDNQLNNRLPIVPLYKVKYMNKEDLSVYKVLKAIFNKPTDTLLNEEKPAHFPTTQEINDIYEPYQKAKKNLDQLVKKIDLSIELKKASLPKYPIQNGITSKDYLHALTMKGLEKRLVLGKKTNQKEKYFKRLLYELDIINKMGYNDYFLIVWDFVRYAKHKGYLVGPGRGSAAASLVSYCLGITNVDPLDFSLVFERFLNPARISMPDIDMDLPDDKRDDVITYVKNKYGKDHVASICTFGTFLTKSAIRDVARITELNGILLEQIIKESETYINIDDMLNKSEKITNIINQNEKARKTLHIAKAIEGLHRHVSTHAAGVILTDQKLTDHTPLQPGLLNMHQTQYEAKDLESLGLLKIDFLGLRNLSSIMKIIELINKKEHKKINIYQLPLNDQKTFKLLQKVQTTGIFQLESKGMRRLLEQFQITKFEDIVTCLALFRPGPMESIPTYLKRRKQEEKITYPHESIIDILKPTNGIIIYQEQIIQIASNFAGYSYAEADILRRAVSKKQKDIMQKERENFINKALNLGRDKQSSELIYDYIVKFANYGFNKAHSVAYAMVSYWMAYLKANYPKYFISVLLTSVLGSANSLRTYIKEGYRLGVLVAPPSINLSTDIFEPDDKYLRFPLLGIKNVGKNAVQEILMKRRQKPFISYVDAVKRLSQVINKRVIESLILAGAFDEFNYTRKAMIEQLENVISFSQLGSHIDEKEFIVPQSKEYEEEVLNQKEEEVLGFLLFNDPLKAYSQYIEKHHLLKPIDVNESYINQIVRIVGKITTVKEIKTKYGDTMAFINLTDMYSEIPCVMFSSEYELYKSEIIKNKVHLLKGKIIQRNNKIQLNITNIKVL